MRRSWKARSRRGSDALTAMESRDYICSQGGARDGDDDEAGGSAVGERWMMRDDAEETGRRG